MLSTGLGIANNPAGVNEAEANMEFESRLPQKKAQNNVRPLALFILVNNSRYVMDAIFFSLLILQLIGKILRVQLIQLIIDLYEVFNNFL